MKITTKWLRKEKACERGVRWFQNQTENEELEVVKKLRDENKLDWGNWLVVRLMSYHQYVSYAVFSSEKVVEIYEKKYPNDKRPRGAIEAAKKCIENPNQENKTDAARAADAAAEAAVNAADAAADCAHASDARAADAVVNAADAASDCAYAAAHASDARAFAAVVNAAEAADSAADDIFKKNILSYGINLLERRHNDSFL